MFCVCQVVEYDSPSVLLQDPESAFSRLLEASKLHDPLTTSSRP